MYLTTKIYRLGFPGLGGFMGKTAEEMQKAVDLYQAELAKLHQRSLLGTPSVSPPSSLSETKKEIKAEEDEAKKRASSPPGIKFAGPVGLLAPPHHPGLFPPPPPPGGPSPSGNPGTAGPASLEEKTSSTSPLQGMASITNSLINQPIPPPYRPAQRSFKAILPPITQEQFDRYCDINTEELVRTVGKRDNDASNSVASFFNSHCFYGANK